MEKLALISYFNGNYKRISKKCNEYGFKVLIYNNSDSDVGLKVKNIGVDAYDKLYFIVKNYENLPDITLFLTDNIFKSQKKIKRFEFILDSHYILYTRPGLITGHISKMLKEDLNFEIDQYKNKKIIKSSIRPFNNWFENFIDKEINLLECYQCKKSIFAVTKDLILRHEKNFYERLLKEVEEHSIFGHDSEVPHYFERAYVYLFCKNNLNLMFHDFKNYKSI